MTLGCFAGFEGFECSLLWIILILIFFIAAMFRKHVAEGLIGMDYSLIGGTAIAEILFIVVIYISHSFKWGFLIAMIGVLAGGFLTAPFLPDGSSEGGGEGGWY